MAAQKKYFDSRKEAIKAAESRRAHCFKMKSGKNKGRYFVGSELEWLNLY